MSENSYLNSKANRIPNYRNFCINEICEASHSPHESTIALRV